MSRYRPANKVRRCPICGELIPDTGKPRGPHFWKKHGFWGAVLWRWDTGHRSLVIAFFVLLVLAGAMGVAIARDAFLK